MKILILGGTGAIGAHLVNLLSGQGVWVTSRIPRTSNADVHYIYGDALEEAFLKSILSNPWDVIVDFMSYSTTAFCDRMDLLLAATAQYCFLSSARVYADSDSPLTEASPRLLDVSSDCQFLATDEYALSKARQENLLMDSGKKNWTIIRPYISYSERRLQLGGFEKEAWLYRALSGRAIIFSKEMAQKKTTMTYGNDVARGIQALLGTQSALGEAFHITCAHALYWKDVVSTYVNVLQQCTGLAVQVHMADLEKFHLCHPARYQTLYDRMYDRVFDNAKIGRHVNTDQFIEPTTGLENSLRSFLKHPQFLAINWGLEGVMDNVTKSRIKFKNISNIVDTIKYIYFRYGIR